MITQNVSFTFNHIGASWEVEANFSRFSATPSEDYDSEWQMDDIEVTGDDGMDWHGELQQVFIRKFASTEMISLASLIEDKAQEELT